MQKLLKRLWRDESGLTILEYGIAAAVLSVAVVGILKVFGGKLKDLFQVVPNEPGVSSSDFEK